MASIVIQLANSNSTANSSSNRVNVEGAVLLVNGNLVSASNPLPVSGGGSSSSSNNQVQGIANGIPVLVTGTFYPNTQPVSIANTVSVETSVQSAATFRGGVANQASVSQQLMPANAARRGWNFQNQGTNYCYIKIGGAATSDYNSIRISPSSWYETPINHVSGGIINVLCLDANSPFYATEW